MIDPQITNEGLTILGIGVGAGASAGKLLLEKLLGPAIEAVGEGTAAPLIMWKERRLANARNLLEGAAETLRGIGLEAQPVPGRLLWPILEKGSLEEDQKLASAWTALLASAAADPDNVLPAFPSILADLSILEAKILDRIDEVHTADKIARRTTDRPSELDPRRDLTDDGLRQFFTIDHLTFSIRVANLSRMELIKRGQTRGDNGEAGECWVLTLLGYAFVNACSRPHLLKRRLSRDDGKQ